MAEKKKSEKQEKKVTKKKAITSTKNVAKAKDTKKKSPKKEVVKKKVIEEKVIPYNDELSTVVDEKEVKEEIKEEGFKKEVESKNDSNWGVLGIVILLIIAIILLGIYSYLASEHSFNSKDFRSLGLYQEPLFRDDYKKVKNEEEFSKYFPNISSNQLNFEEKDYIILSVIYDSCRESNLKPVGYTLDQGIITVRLNYERSCGVCAPQYLYYLLELEKNLDYHSVYYDFHPTNNPNCDDNMVYKPIIYIYPQEKTNVKLILGNSNLLKFTYPTYQNGWEVEAYPEGKLIDNNGREYYALFWEGVEHKAKVEKDGFIIKGTDTKEFLEDSLRKLGLTDKEANEFIIYWLPQLEVNNYNYIRFESMNEIDEYMPLIIDPTPESIIRIQMDYLPLDKPITVEKQVLETPVREGYTVVEWGGSKIKE